MRRWLSRLDDALLVAALAGGSWWGYGQVTEPDRPKSVESAASPDGQRDGVLAVDELDQLDRLDVKGRAPKTGYDRDAFGQRWADVDRNGCDTRNDILARDLTDVVYRSGTNDCVVDTGVLVDPYSGQRIEFMKGNTTSTAVQIDHVVALADAWQKGAQAWDAEKRLRFANDPLNLLAVGRTPNQQKGDGDAATWLPANKPYRCAYAARQVAVKAEYGLWVTPAERDQLAAVLKTCPSQAALLG